MTAMSPPSTTKLLIAVAFAALLSGCIDSAAPILADAQPVLGPKLNLQLYTLRDGHASDPERARFVWDGRRYARARGGMTDIAGFTLHPFEAGYFIVQSISLRHPEHAEYAVMHPLADGVYFVNAIDEDDADAATRAKLCEKTEKYSCRISTHEQLVAFARATVAKHQASGGLAIRLEAGAPKKR